VAAPSDNSREKSSKNLSTPTGKGIVIDIGTGDGRFVSALAKRNPKKFYIGVDANRKALEKPSMRATSKPAKGGLPNAMFVQAAVEDLPEEFAGVADEIHIHFPWGSLLRGVVNGEPDILASLRRISARGSLLEIVISIDPVRDRGEMDRLGISDMDLDRFSDDLASKYVEAGFKLMEHRRLGTTEWSKIDTTWARKLAGNRLRNVQYLAFESIE
jgi:16S rRNA (adenine(1408)-N(1))-methyltransferase